MAVHGHLLGPVGADQVLEAPDHPLAELVVALGEDAVVEVVTGVVGQGRVVALHLLDRHVDVRAVIGLAQVVEGFNRFGQPLGQGGGGAGRPQHGRGGDVVYALGGQELGGGLGLQAAQIGQVRVG